MTISRPQVFAAFVGVTISLFALNASAQSDAIPISCPTITYSAYPPRCTKIPICAEPDCILEDQIVNPCACPAILATKTSFYTDCACHPACGTAYDIERPTGCRTTTGKPSTAKPTTTTQTPIKPTTTVIKTTPTPTTTPTTTSKPVITICPTHTIYTEQAGVICPDICVVDDLVPIETGCVTSRVPLPCGCTDIAIRTACPNCSPCTTYIGLPEPCLPPTAVVTTLIPVTVR